MQPIATRLQPRGALGRGFVLTRGNDNGFNGPELTDYAAQCHGAGLMLQQTRGSRAGGEVVGEL